MTNPARPFGHLSNEDLEKTQENNDAAWRAANDRYNVMSPYDGDRRTVFNHIRELSDEGHAIRGEFALRRDERQQRDQNAGIPSDPNRRYQSHSDYELQQLRGYKQEAWDELTVKLNRMMPSDEDRRAVSDRVNELVDELAEIDGELATR